MVDVLSVGAVVLVFILIETILFLLLCVCLCVVCVTCTGNLTSTNKTNILIMDAAKMSSPSVTREDELQQLAIHAAGNRFPNERRPYGMFSLLEGEKKDVD